MGHGSRGRDRQGGGDGVQEQPGGKVTPRQLAPQAALGRLPAAADDANTFGILDF